MVPQHGGEYSKVFVPGLDLCTKVTNLRGEVGDLALKLLEVVELGLAPPPTQEDDDPDARGEAKLHVQRGVAVDLKRGLYGAQSFSLNYKLTCRHNTSSG